MPLPYPVNLAAYSLLRLQMPIAAPHSISPKSQPDRRFHLPFCSEPPDRQCPELNPIERLWEYLKADLKWASFKTLDQLQAKVDQLLAQLTSEVIASITGYSFILDALSALNPG